MTAAILSDDFVKSYADKKIPWGFNGLGEIVYRRTYARDIENENRKEEWHETIQRCVNGAQEIGAEYTEEEAERLFDYIFNLKGAFSGRALWQLGSPLVKKFSGASLNNCYFTNIETIDDFNFVFDHLMLGGGVGFSVERSKVHSLPKVKDYVSITHMNTYDADIIVPDSRQGWSRLLHSILKSYFYTGKPFSYSTILIRSFGAPLKTFGGTASGPEALISGVEDICAVLDARAGKKVRSVDVLDIVNIIGRIVVSGSSRRSAQLAAGDPDDFLFIRAKNWGRGNIPSWRGHSNNSIYADSYEEIIDEIWKGYDGSGEPYGFLNRNLARTQGRLGQYVDDSGIDGFNPCAEIGLSGEGEACNLSTIFLPNVESYEELTDISKLLYRTQKAITNLSYPYKKSENIIKKNRRLGQSITGWLQASEEQLSWVSDVYEGLVEYDEFWSKQQGINTSIKLTASQPSGTLSLLAGVTPGLMAAEGRYWIRRITLGAADPLVDYCRQKGHHVEYRLGLGGKEDRNAFIVSFPCEAPETAILKSELTAVDQLEWVKKVQTLWADNAVSVTVRYSKEELSEIKEWLKENYETSIKSAAFLLKEDHGFVQAPYEEITKEEYDRMVKKIKDIEFEGTDTGSGILDVECDGNACPIR